MTWWWVPTFALCVWVCWLWWLLLCGFLYNRCVSTTTTTTIRAWHNPTETARALRMRRYFQSCGSGLAADRTTPTHTKIDREQSIFRGLTNKVMCWINTEYLFKLMKRVFQFFYFFYFLFSFSNVCIEIKEDHQRIGPSSYKTKNHWPKNYCKINDKYKKQNRRAQYLQFQSDGSNLLTLLFKETIFIHFHL